MRTLAKQLVIIGFVTWHAFAIAVYSTPREAQDPVGKWMRENLVPRVMPYVLITSQWQLWNLFSPDPLRRVTFYKVDVWDGVEWHEVTTYQPGSFSIWRHATQFKMLGNLLDENAQNRSPLAGRFLHLFCKEKDIPADTRIRLQYVHYTIPYHTERHSRAWWDAWNPEFGVYTGFETACPPQS